MNESAEQQARDLLERMGVERAQEFSAGEIVELANLIRDKHAHATTVKVSDITTVHAPKLEYEILNVLPTDSTGDIRSVLNRMGERGWELIAIPQFVEGSATWQLVFKRPTP